MMILILAKTINILEIKRKLIISKSADITNSNSYPSKKLTRQHNKTNMS